MATCFLVLTEDTGREAIPAFKGLLKLIVNFYENGREVVQVRPGDAQEYPSVGSNRWRGNKERDSEPRRRLCKGIADALAREEIVVFHTDADATWSAGYAHLSLERQEDSFAGAACSHSLGAQQ